MLRIRDVREDGTTPVYSFILLFICFTQMTMLTGFTKPRTHDCYHSDNRAALRGVKAIPLQAETGPEGSRRLKLPDFETIGT